MLYILLHPFNDVLKYIITAKYEKCKVLLIPVWISSSYINQVDYDLSRFYVPAVLLTIRHIWRAVERLSLSEGGYNKVR